MCVYVHISLSHTHTPILVWGRLFLPLIYNTDDMEKKMANFDHVKMKLQYDSNTQKMSQRQSGEILVTL